jgi:DNA-binding NtrC family response regulator
MDATIARSGRREVRGGTIRVLPDGPTATIGDEPITIGRHASCSVVVADPQVSSVHLELVATEDGVRLRDLGSKNGTRIGGARIDHAMLVASCRIQLGDSALAFEPAAAGAAIEATVDSIFGLAGQAPAMQQVLRTVARAAPTNLTVLLLGETGTGKEVAARAIHQASRRAAGPFVVVDCGAISPALAEAHLFGHEKGAFTGAVTRRESPFVEASGGTLFLDELGELPLELQPKLLRALAEHRVKRVGGSTYQEFDARIIAATRRDLSREMNDGAFRSDLYFRVAELRLELPPLRERLSDIPLLVRRILAGLGDEAAYERISTETLECLMHRSWPGNVRELKNAVTVAHALSDGGPLDVATHGGDGTAPEMDVFASASGYHEAKRQALERFERAYFAALAASTGGVIVEMARLAGLERAHVRKYLKRHGLGGRKS